MLISTPIRVVHTPQSISNKKEDKNFHKRRNENLIDLKSCPKTLKYISIIIYNIKWQGKMSSSPLLLYKENGKIEGRIRDSISD